jgi:Cu2+-exporting ATPase
MSCNFFDNNSNSSPTFSNVVSYESKAMAQLTVDLPSSSTQLPVVTATPTPKNNLKVAYSSKPEQLAVVERPKVAYAVVHAIPGRIRFRIPRVRNTEYAQRLQILLESNSLVNSVRIKPSAASVVVTYKANKTSETKARSHFAYIIQTANDEGVVFISPTKLSSQANETEEKPRFNIPLSVIATSLALLSGPLGLAISPMFLAGTIALATLPVAKRAVEGITNERKLNIDFLDFMAIAITTVQGQFLTPALMLSLIDLGENIRERTARSSAQQTLDLMGSLGQFAWVERDGVKTQIPIQQVQAGDTVIVYPGEQVPVDGVILQGKALLDEQKLTGESVPVMKHKGENVYASTLVREGQVYIKTERVGDETCAGQSIKLIQQAPIHDTRMENHAVKIADRAVLPTLLLGGTVFALTRNPARAASILTLDLCTGIRVSIPTTVLAALSYAARRGILIRSGRALELLAEIDTVVFDKTGTLTQGEVAVVGVESFQADVPSMRVLALAAAAEKRLTHPVAEAVVRYAEGQKVENLPRGEWNYQLGLGVEAEIDGEKVYVGSERFLRQQEIDMSPLEGKEQAPSAIYVGDNERLLGIIEYSDLLRPESRKVINALLTVEGVEVHMLTGDNKRTAKAVAAQLGITPKYTHAEAFPEQKATVVRKLHEQGKTVAFVGDGINDSPALAYADVSVSFASGSDVARETADVVLMENNLNSLLEAIEIARQAKKLIGQNTNMIVVPNVAALAVAVLFGLNPLAATVVNNGSTVAAGLNGLRPMMKKG